MRITAQLIDAPTGTHLWAERYDRDLTDIFAVQDDVTRMIVRALKITLSPTESARLADAGTTSVAAHDAFLHGRELIMAPSKNRDTFERAIELFDRAIALDPAYGAPYAGLAIAHNMDYHNNFTSRGKQALDVAASFAEKGVDRSPNDPFVRFVSAIVAIFGGDLARAMSEADAALAVNPNYALAHGARGTVDLYLGNPIAAIPYFERAVRLDPAFTGQQTHFLGTAFLIAGKYEAAAALFRERIRLAPETDLSRGFLASALGHLGEKEEAARVWRELKEINPKYSMSEHLGRLPFKKPADVDRIREGLAKAGLPPG